MTKAQRSNGGAGNEAERARHIASAETVGFATTAATMLLGLVAGAEAREHMAQDHGQPPPALPQSPAHAQAAPPRTEVSPAHDTVTGDTAAHIVPAAEAAPGLPAAHHAAPDSHAHSVGSGRVIEPAAPVASPHAATSSDHTGPHGPAPIAPPHLAADASFGAQQQETVQHATLLDGALANLSQIGDTVNATLQHITTTLSGDVAHLAGSLSAMTSTLTSSLSGMTADALHPGGSGQVAAHMAVDLPHVDTAGVIPVAFTQPPPVTPGFIGQPTADGHDTHDGAFSALGLHHF